jgi:hypothetical protein
MLLQMPSILGIGINILPLSLSKEYPKEWIFSMNRVVNGTEDRLHNLLIETLDFTVELRVATNIVHESHLGVLLITQNKYKYYYSSTVVQ